MYPSSNSSPICSPLFNIPSPCTEYENELFYQYYHHHFLQHQQPLTHDDHVIIPANDDTVVISGKEGCSNKKKTSKKKDRHSKINTAQGPRDRRIRLSNDISRIFFNLQDVLGFDKASKTVEWLLVKSTSAIKDLTNSASSTSECTQLVSNDNLKQTMPNDKRKSSNKAKSARRTSFHPLAKETRKKARQRARERTQLKKKYQLCEPHVI